MFIGHFAVGFAAKKYAPKTSLGILFASAQFLDLLWPVLLLAGIEHVRIDPGNTVMTPLDFYDYPYSHSLLMVAVWAGAAGLGYDRFKKYRAGGVAVTVAVLSHWLLDLPMHRPDLPLMPFGELKLGLGLWNSPTATILFEGLVFAAGLALYLKHTQAQDKVGKYGLGAMVFLLVGIWAGNFMGPPPPDSQAIAILGNAQWLFVIMGYWVDRHRRAVTTAR